MVVAVRRLLHTRRVGHAGSLDPFATGLLVVLVGRTTRLARFVLGLPKTYDGTIRLGVTTATDDPTGEPLQSSDSWNTIGDAQIEQALASMVGKTMQRPPNFSAKLVEGRRAYRRARKGEAFELDPQPVDVYRLDLVKRAGATLAVRAEVGSGVYIRALARDLGAMLGCGAHLTTLRRLSVGPFSVADATAPENFGSSPPALRPARDAVAHLPSVELNDDARAAVRHGRAIPAVQVAGAVALMAGEALVAVAESDGEWFRPTVVFESA